jgi:hypothetical protein
VQGLPAAAGGYLPSLAALRRASSPPRLPRGCRRRMRSTELSDGGNVFIPMTTLMCAMTKLLIAVAALILAVAARAALDPEVVRLTPPATSP